MPRIVLEHVSKSFPVKRGTTVQALDDLSLSIEEHEFVVLVGPSGCGKTTTLRLIAGLDFPDRGHISIDGRDMREVHPKDRNVAMIFQQPALYPHLTIFENMAFGLKVRKMPRAEAEKKVRETANWLDLNPCLDRLPSQLSGGQQQRVAIGRAVVRGAKVLLLDEPLSNLDAPARAQMRSELTRVHEQLGLTTLYVTHEQSEAMMLGERIALLHAGRLQQVAPPNALYNQPANAFTAGFFGTPPMNFFEGKLARNAGGLFFQMRGALLSLPAETSATLRHGVGSSLLLGLRPEAIHIGGSHSAAPSLTAVVENIQTLGYETLVRLRWNGCNFVARIGPECELQLRAQVEVRFAFEKACWFAQS